MKISLHFTALLISCAAATVSADPISFGANDDPLDHFYISANSGSLRFQRETSDTLLVFESGKEASKNGALVAVFGSKNNWLRSLANEFSLEFRLPQNGSFGVQVRSADPKEQGYLILVNQDGANRGMLKIFKTTLLPPSGDMARDVIATKAVIPLLASEWHRLSIIAENGDSGHVKITTRLKDIATENEVELIADDRSDPLESDGLVAMRFYLKPSVEGEFEESPRVIEVRKPAISPALK